MKNTVSTALLLGALCLLVAAGTAVAGETIGMVRTATGDATVTRGTMAYLSGLIGKLAPEKARFETPTATIGIRGTRFAVKVWDPSAR